MAESATPVVYSPVAQAVLAVQELTPAEKFHQMQESASPGGSYVNGKQNGAPIDVASDEAFPTIGGAPAKVTTGPVKWGANAALVHPPSDHDATGSRWTPTIGHTAQQAIYTLQKGDKRPASELRKQAGDIAREVARKTNTKIDAANNKERGSTTYIILGGSAADRERARRELMRELTVRVTRKVSVPAVIRPFIIGKGGSKIQELQAKTLTNIKVPQPESVDTESGEYEDDAVIDVIIEGDSEGCRQAAELVEKIAKERVIKVTRTIAAPGRFYPFIQGSHMSNIQEYENLVDRVIVPDYFSTSSPPPDFSEPAAPIQVIGEKSAVEQVVTKIKAQINSLEAAKFRIQGVDVGAFRTLLFTRNNGELIREILAGTGCAVIVPPLPVHKVYVVGPTSRTSEAMNAVLRKVEEYKLVALDLCKAFVTAPDGAKAHAMEVLRHARKTPEVRQINKECDVELIYPTPDILYDLGKPCYIFIIGKSKEYVDAATKRVVTIFGSYTPERVAHINVDPLHHKYIIGKDGKGAKKISAQTTVELLFPEDSEDESIALIYEGDSKDSIAISEALEKTKAEILEIVKGQVEIVTKMIDIPKELHDKIRGDRGSVLNALNPSSISVQFGAPKARLGKPAPSSDPSFENKVILRGPPSNVSATAANINDFVNSTKDRATPEIVSEPFEYPVQYTGNLIGSKGANRNKLRDDFGVEIKLTGGHGEIRGVKVCIEAARRKLIAQIKELEDKAVILIKVPQQFHSIIIGSEGSTVRRLEERYGVRINFPKASKVDEDGEAASRQAADEIVIRGSKKGAEEARQEITDLWKYEADNSHTATVMVLAKSVGYMFKNASKDIKQLRDESAARIIIPQEDKNADPDSTVEIKIRGTKDAVNHAQTVLSKIAKNAENTTSRTISVDKKYHRSLIGPGGQTLRDIVVKAGGPDDRVALARLVRFPNQGSESNEIVVQGHTSIVDQIVALIEKIVSEKDSQVMDAISVAPDKHRKLIGREGVTRRELESQFNVTIDIPRQRPGQPQNNPSIKITGEPEAVTKAKEHILELVKEPEGETLEVPRRLHHAVADGGLFKQLQKEFRVTVDHNGLPRPAKPEDPKPKVAKDMPLIIDEGDEERISWEIVENSSIGEEGTYPWVLRGQPDKVAKAKALIETAIETAEKQSYTGYLTLPDSRKYRYVVGPGGSTVDRIRKETGCRITVPRSQSVVEAITLHGDKEGLENAKDAILQVVRSNGGGRGPN